MPKLKSREMHFESGGIFALIINMLQLLMFLVKTIFKYSKLIAYHLRKQGFKLKSFQLFFVDLKRNTSTQHNQQSVVVVSIHYLVILVQNIVGINEEIHVF